MRGILQGKVRLLIRKPGAFLASTIICIAFAFVTGMSSQSKIEIPVYSTLPENKLQPLVNELNHSDAYIFKIEEEEKVKNRVAEGKAEVGILLQKDQFTLFRVGNTQNVYLINNYLESYYKEKLQKQTIKDLAKQPEEAKKIINKLENEPPLTLNVESFKDKEKPVYNQILQSLFGFCLFFVVYTVSFNVVEILREKQEGIWDRFILSPTSKTEVYLANLIYCFLIGYFQIFLIFAVFKYGAGVDFYGGFNKALIVIIPYLFAIVALSIFLTGIVKTMPHFNAIISFVNVCMAMLGGAYWPIEIVKSKLLIGISKVVPLTYGMVLLKGVTQLGQSISQLLYPISILLLMGVVLMGIGIRLIERRSV